MYGSPVAAAAVLERADDPLVHRRRRQRLPLRVLGAHPALAAALCAANAAMSRATAAVDASSSAPRMSSEKRTRLAIALISPGSTSISPIGADRSLAPRARASRSSSRTVSASDQRRVEPEIHRRRAGVVAAAVDDDVRVDVAGDGVDDADPVAGVLEHPRLLDVHLDPAGEPVQHGAALAPARGLVARVLGVLPEAAAVVDRAEPLLQVLLGDPLRDDPAAEQHLAEARALLLEERDQLQRQAEAELRVQAADLERGDDAHRPVVLAAVPVRVAVRADAEGGLARRAGCGRRACRPGPRTTSKPIGSSSRVK